MQLSTELVTHRLKIKGEGIRLLTLKQAEDIYEQLSNKSTTITISNKETLTYVQKYKNEVELMPIDENTKTIEDKLIQFGLNESQKEKVRNIIETRKQDGKTTNDIILVNICNHVKNSD